MIVLLPVYWKSFRAATRYSEERADFRDGNRQLGHESQAEKDDRNRPNANDEGDPSQVQERVPDRDTEGVEGTHESAGIGGSRWIYRERDSFDQSWCNEAICKCDGIALMARR